MLSNHPVEGEVYPEPNNDLPEFDEFLKQLGYGHLYRNLPEDEVSAAPACESPAEIVVSTSPSTGTARRIMTRIVATVAALAAILVLFWVPIMGALGSLKTHAAPDGFMASPYFSLERFHSIRPGMTANEVRDRVGLPLARRLRTGPGHEAWIYSAPKNSEQPRFLLCVLTVENGIVSSARATLAETRGNLGYLWPVAPMQEVGDLTLIRSDGKRHTLHALHNDLALLTSLDDEKAALAAQIPGGRLYSVEATGEAGRTLNTPAVSSTRANTYAAPRVAFPSTSVYWKGRLVALPWHAQGVPESAHSSDLRWLLAHV